jgi:hypothetical protein
LPAGSVGDTTMAHAILAIPRDAVTLTLQLFDLRAALFAMTRLQIAEFALVLLQGLQATAFLAFEATVERAQLG